MNKPHLAKELIQQLFQAMPKKSRYLTKDEIRQRIELLATLSPPNALRG
jgi:hypothetical protein